MSDSNWRETGFFNNMTDAALEAWYAEVLGGCRTGGYNDGGKDVKYPDGVERNLQVKPNEKWGVDHYRKALGLQVHPVPLAVGHPGTRPEMLSWLRKYEVWVGYNIPKRMWWLNRFLEAKTACDKRRKEVG